MGIGSLLAVQNPGTPFDQAWIDLAPHSASFDSESPPLSQDDIRLIASLLDLTSLNSDDSQADILELFESAFEPLPESLPPEERQGEVPAGGWGRKLPAETLTVAGVCIFPEFLGLAGTWVRSRGVRLVTVAGDFPHGLGLLSARCSEIGLCAKMADEVDFPIDRRLALAGRWEELYWETRDMVRAARGVPTKVILATGELPDQTTIYRAASVAMMAGASFVKTSTGKERVNARLDAGAIMCRAIKDYFKRTGCMIGLKPAGGIRSTSEAMGWLQLVRSKLGDEWVTPELFRIGASSLLEHLRYAIEA